MLGTAHIQSKQLQFTATFTINLWKIATDQELIMKNSSADISEE